MQQRGHKDNKAIYGSLHDRIIDKRMRSVSPIRQYAHRTQYRRFVDVIPVGSTVIDAGCGEGVLSVMLAKHGCTVTGVDLSEPNIAAAKKYAEEEGVADRVIFLVGDAEHLPVENKSFDYAVSSHVLEHVPDFVQGVRELHRVARTGVIVAIPTCFNPCAWVLLGGDRYWTVSRRTLFALPLGLLRVLIAFLTGREGVNEGYAGRSELIHIWRFPWRGRHLLEQGGLQVRSWQASSFPFPYVSFLVPLSRLLDVLSRLLFFRACGYGTTYICIPEQ